MSTHPVQQPAGPPPTSPRNGLEDLPSTRSVLRVVFIVLLVIAVVAIVRLLWQPLSWIVIATFLAVALAGPVNLLNRHMRRGLAIAVVYSALILIPIGIAAAILPPLVNQGVEFVNHLPKYSSDLRNEVQKNPKLERLNRKFGITDKLNKLATDAPSRIGEAATVVRDLGASIISSIFAGLTIFVLSIFMVARGRQWIESLLRLRAGPHADAAAVALERIAGAVANYIAGAVIQATVAAVTAFIVLTALGVPFAGALAVLVGLFDLLPLVGATIAAVFVGIVTLFNNFPADTIIWAVFAVAYQQFENYVIQPQIQKRAVQLEPFIVLVSVLFGATLFGIVGAILAIPFAASVQIAVQEWWRFRTAENLVVVHEERHEHPPDEPGPGPPADGAPDSAPS
ncbi:MAG TPA: AI-2E family transporter [Solirubrobacteraceae bacterium]|nr:AI-2E family transporter [Solirubrobacteraceae bacterium]